MASKENMEDLFGVQAGVDGSKTFQELSSILQRKSKRDGELYVRITELQKELQLQLDSFRFPSTCDPATLLSGKEMLARSRELLGEFEMAKNLAKTSMQRSSALAVQYWDAREKVDTIALRVGFSSLPDDILSEILELSTRPIGLRPSRCPDTEIFIDVELRALQEARSLSHVCRKFRSLVLNNPRLWNIISDHMVDHSRVRTYLERSKEAPMDILLESFGLRQKGHNAFTKLFKLCLLSSKNWRSFMVGWVFSFGVDNLQTRRKRSTIRENMHFIGRNTMGMRFPKLKRLDACFSHELFPKNWGPNFYPFCRWPMPNLVDLRISGYHPPPAHVSFIGSLRFLRVQSDANRGEAYEMAQLARFLSVCKVLEKVDLRFKYWLSASSCPIHDIPTVRDISVRFEYCKVAASASICNSLRFSTATKAYLSLYNDIFIEHAHFDVVSEELAARRDSLIHEFLLKHPLLKTLRLDSSYSSGESFTPVAPPIHVLPSLEKLILKFVSWQELVFWDIPSSSNTKFLPSVRSLELHTYNLALQWDRLRIWLERFFAQLKKQGDIDTFELFSIYNKEKFDPCVLSKGLLSELLPSEKIFVHQASS